MGDYGWSMNFDTPQGIDAVEYGRVLEYPKRRNKSQTTRKPDLNLSIFVLKIQNFLLNAQKTKKFQCFDQLLRFHLELFFSNQ